MARFDDIVDMYQRVFGSQRTREQIEQSVIKNIQLPSSTPTPRGRTNDEVKELLRNLHGSYQEAIRDELANGSLMSTQRKRTLELALTAPTMDLSLVSSRQARDALDEQWQEIVRRRI